MNVQTKDSVIYYNNSHYKINLEYIVARNRNHAAMIIMLKNMFFAFTVGGNQSIYPFKIRIA